MDSRPTFGFSGPLRVDGPGLQLREGPADDVADLVALHDDPEIDRWTPVVPPFDTETAQAYPPPSRNVLRGGWPSCGPGASPKGTTC